MSEMTTAAGRLLPCGDSADAMYCETFWAQHAELEQLRAQLAAACTGLERIAQGTADATDACTIAEKALYAAIGNEPVPAAASALTVQGDAACGSAVVVDEDDAYPCGALSRYLVERSDGDKSYGENGGSAEACGEHLAATVDGMVDGDENVQALVTIRWDKP